MGKGGVGGDVEVSKLTVAQISSQLYHTYMNALQWLNGLRPAIPLSMEKPCSVMSNGELKRLMVQGGILVNGETVVPDEEIDFPVFSLVFFPKSKRRTTVW